MPMVMVLFVKNSFFKKKKKKKEFPTALIYTISEKIRKKAAPSDQASHG
jgi:hypothetical protein